jgi:hypothetical protein
MLMFKFMVSVLGAICVLGSLAVGHPSSVSGGQSNKRSQLSDLPAPTVEVYGAANEHQFVVTCKNDSGDLIFVYGSGLTQVRADGEPFDRGTISGSSGRHTVQVGESWKELVQLVAAKPQTFTNPKPREFFAHARIVLRLSPGRHAVAFSCGGAWSKQFQIDWSE